MLPLTKVRTLPGPSEGVGVRFVAHTSLGPLGVDDPMEVTRWQPPDDEGSGDCHVEKTGRLVTGWVEIAVTPESPGSLLVWRQDLVLPWLGPLGRLPGRLVGPLFYRLLVDRLLARPA